MGREGKEEREKDPGARRKPEVPKRLKREVIRKAFRTVC